MKRCFAFVLVGALVLLPGMARGAIFDPDDDGDIDLVDYQAFVDCFDGPAVAASPTCAGSFDENGDSYVDLYDFRGFQIAFGRECSESFHCDDDNPCTEDACVDFMCEYTFAPDTTLCRAAAGDCDAAEYCTGSSADCPADDFLPDTTECRTAAGDCDVTEYCTGAAADCPADDFLPDTTECRAAAGDCDAAEYCTGAAADCPADDFLPDTTECRAAAGDCDAAEYCTGAAADCPADGFLPDTTECRAPAGDCDAAEYCTGTSTDCPADAFLPDTTECRADAGDCDVPEYCTGASADCPADGFEPAGTPCPDGLFCNGDDTCDDFGVCQPGDYPCTDPEFPECDEVNDECIAEQAYATSAELAGNSLGAYPFFEYVKAFNEDATVELAIDPTRFPDIVGLTCDIYVVDAKTAGQWQADPSLVDVTAGGALTESFGGTTIQENTFTVVGPSELDSEVYDENTGDYTGLGAAYDMVMDCNQNGQLDGGDYIDGLSREAGLYIVHDVSLQGPLSVTETLYSGGSWLDQDLYYPTDIASMGELPLVVISHGNGHNYQWYDHIGFHMASYGYVVMSHSNNTGPGIETASTTTLTNTDYIIGNQGSIAGGVLDGHLDSHHITWIGHSRGGEGITRAYDRIFDGTYTPSHFVIEDVVLLSSMLPTDFLKTSSANPHDVNYHLWTASGDADVNGSAGCDLCQTFHLHDRATRFRQSTVVQGTGHGDFHAASGSVFTGPCHIEPKSKVHDIMQGYFLPLIKHYIEGNIPGTDFLWRQYERFHPISVDLSDPCIVVSHEYRNGDNDGNFIIDDYQTETTTSTSSSGGSVTYTVQNVTEGRLDDNNTSFSWTSSDPFNGATQASSEGQDDSRGVVFDWTDSDRYYEWEIITEERDFSDDLYLSFRGAQGTQHPNTLAVLGDLTFTVTLRDGAGTSSSINIGTYGGGFEQPYQRSGGWHNEMEVIRIRLTDFLTNGSGLDLTDIVAIRLNFGPSWGSDEGRIVVDEMMLTNNYPPFFVPLTIGLTSAAPEYLPPGVPTVIEVEILEGTDTIVTDSALLHYRYDGGTWLTSPLVQTFPGSELYEGTLPAPSCGDTPEFYLSVEGSITGVVYDPPTAPSSPYIAFVGVYDGIFVDDFEADLGWTVENDPSLTDGQWERAIPSTDGSYDEPMEDYDGSGYCYVTENVYHDDVDGGPTILTSPTIDLSARTNPVLRYARWWANDDQDGDPMDVEISNDDGGTWLPIETVINIPPGWVERVVYITDYVTPLTNQMKIRFSVADVPNNSKDEGGIDAVEIFEIQCSD
jgi:hypothetical protein